MANWNIKKKNGENVTFNDNPRTRTTENYTQNNFIEQNATVNGFHRIISSNRTLQ